MDNHKNPLKLIIVSVVCLILGGLITYFVVHKIPAAISELPKPELSEGQRGQLGIDKNINESTIDNYLNRPDSVYYDMRMLEDPANYESIGGDRFLSGFIRGFEIIPLPYLIPADGLPESVGQSYQGTTLFSPAKVTTSDSTDSSAKTSDSDQITYLANYRESEQILSDLFPKDKNIFLMCGGGGYAGMTKNLLVSLGWDANKIYNVGGYWYYNGQNNIQVKYDNNGENAYAFWKVPYHNIDFTKLTKLEK